MIPYDIALKKVMNHRPLILKQIQKIMLWDETATLRENAIKLGITIPSASQFTRIFELKQRKVRGWLFGPKPASEKARAYIDLRKSGWPLPAIAKLFQVSRQCVQQVIAEKGK